MTSLRQDRTYEDLILRNLTSSQKASRDYYDDDRRGSNTITGKTYVNEDGGTSKTEDFGQGRVTTVKTKSALLSTCFSNLLCFLSASLVNFSSL